MSKTDRGFMRKLWKSFTAKKHWESRMGWEYFLLIFIGSVIAGIGLL
jgi:hypothetical protein